MRGERNSNLRKSYLYTCYRKQYGSEFESGGDSGLEGTRVFPRPPDRRRVSPWKITVKGGACAIACDASVASALDGDLCAARGCLPRGGRPTAFAGVVTGCRGEWPVRRGAGAAARAAAATQGHLPKERRAAPAAAGVLRPRPLAVGCSPTQRAGGTWSVRPECDAGRPAWRAEGAPLKKAVEKVVTRPGAHPALIPRLGGCTGCHCRVSVRAVEALTSWP